MQTSSSLPVIRPTVLVVDDSLEALNGLCNLLRTDCNALFGFNGLEALALATSESPDLIVLDVAMPGMDGYEVLRRLKEEPTTRDIPVIFLTAPGPNVSELRALELGAIDFVTKPYDPSILKLRMHNQLAYKRSLDMAMAMSMGDALTGIANRRRFDDYLQQEWARAMRHQKPISMILMDIDHFKRFNDKLGHPAGDVCIQKVATTLKSSLKRSMDFVARYGGEEFACILSETEAQGALDVAQRIVANLAAAALPHPDSPVNAFVTLSLGVATMVPGADQLPQDLTHEADRRLYEAKRLGRNRIHSHSVSADPQAPQAEPVLQAPEILLISTSSALRSTVLTQLSLEGIRTTFAADLNEAILALRNPPQAIILDMSESDRVPVEIPELLRALQGCEQMPMLGLCRPDQTPEVEAMELQGPLITPVDPKECRRFARLLIREAALNHAEKTDTRYR